MKPSRAALRLAQLALQLCALDDEAERRGVSLADVRRTKRALRQLARRTLARGA